MTRLIPLDQLRFGHEADPPINARKIGREAGIAELAASIGAHGLITALRVREIAGVPYVGIGNRRLAAMRLLVEQGQMPPDNPVECIDFDDTVDDPREVALAEQIMRAPLHEADQYEEFRTLADAGLLEASIASRFGIEPARVKRILALGRLSPVILAWWREQEPDARVVQTVRAFTLAPSIEDQERVFAKLEKQRNLHSGAILAAFGGGDRDVAKHIKIAGLQAYRDAGGEVTQDLFGDNHIIADKALALRVAEEKIAAVLVGLKAEGWSWVSMASDLPHSWAWGWPPKLKPGDGKATAAEKKQIKNLEKAITKGNESAADDLDTLRKVIAGRQWTPDQLAKGGAVLDVGYHGDLTITRGVVKPEAPKKEAAAPGQKVEKVPSISNAMAMRLSAQAGLATRAALYQEPRLGLIALLAGFLTKRSMYDGARTSPVRVSHEGMGHQALRGEETFETAFARLQEMSDAELFVVAARIAGNAINLHVGDAAQKPFDGAPAALAAAIEPNRMGIALREHFDAADYFGGVAKPFMIQAIREAINEDEARKAEKMKKAELVAFALANVPQTGWLPPELRCATYGGPGEIPRLEAAPPPLDDPDFDEIDEDEDQNEAA